MLEPYWQADRLKMRLSPGSAITRNLKTLILEASFIAMKVENGKFMISHLISLLTEIQIYLNMKLLSSLMRQEQGELTSR